MVLTWTVVAPAISAAFLSSLVEAVEALTIVLAVGAVRGWRAAILGALAGLLLLGMIVLLLGPLLRSGSTSSPTDRDWYIAAAVRHALAAEGDFTRRWRYSAP
jgi:hypothetical protein